MNNSNEPKVLELGIMTNKELAEWFGIKPKTLSQTKKKKLQELEEYARFDIVKSKVRIKEIYSPIYMKKSSRNYEYYRREVPQEWRINDLDTCSRVAAAIYKDSLGIAEKTGEYYTATIRNELWGKPDRLNPNCKHELAKMYRSQDGDKSKTRYEAFTPEDCEIYQKVFQEYFGDLNIASRERTIIRDQVKAGQLSKEEAYDLIMQEAMYPSFLKALSVELGCDFVVRATRVSE